MTTINDDLAIQRAMMAGVDRHIREALRERFQEQADVVINKAIEEAMVTFEASVRRAHDAMNMHDVVSVVLTDRRQSTASGLRTRRED